VDEPADVGGNGLGYLVEHGEPGDAVHSPPDSRGAAKHLLLADVRWLACRDRVMQQRPVTDGGLLQQRVVPFRDSRSVRKVMNVGASANEMQLRAGQGLQPT